MTEPRHVEALEQIIAEQQAAIRRLWHACPECGFDPGQLGVPAAWFCPDCGIDVWLELEIEGEKVRIAE